MTRLLTMISILILLMTSALAGTAEIERPHASDLPPQLTLEWLHAGFSRASPFSTSSGIYDLVACLGIRESGYWEVEVPVSSVGVEDDGGLSGTKVGNIGVGHVWRQESGSIYSLDVSLPTMSNDSSYSLLYPVIADLNRFERFAPDVFTIRARAGRRSRGEGVVLHWTAGPKWLVPVGDNEGDAEMVLRYGAGLSTVGEFVMSATISGGWIMTSDNADFSEASWHQLTLGGQLTVGRVRPGIFLALPLDEDLKDYLDRTLIVRISLN